MRSSFARGALVSATVIAGFGLSAASPGMAQTRLASLEEMRRELATGDFITLVPTSGEPISGRLIRLGNADLDIRPGENHTPQGSARRDFTIALDAIQSLERPRDPSRNGAVLGAGIGAGFGGAMLVHAIAVDRNEMEEWVGVHAGATAICTGIGALIGWAMDAAHSKPHIRFDALSVERTKVRVQPALSRGRGLALTVSFSR